MLKKNILVITYQSIQYLILIENQQNSRTTNFFLTVLVGLALLFLSFTCIRVSLLVWHQSYSSSSPTIDWCTCLMFKIIWTSLSLTYIISCCIFVSNLSTGSIHYSHLPVKLLNLFYSTCNYSIIKWSKGLVWGVSSLEKVDSSGCDHFY
jgi:hypothetical protein